MRTWKEAILEAMQILSIHKNQEIQDVIIKNNLIELNESVDATISKNLDLLEKEGKVEKICHGYWRLK